LAEEKRPNIHVALAHFPVYDKKGEIVVSSVTTLDVHDISRICRTYDVDAFYVVTPLQAQQELVGNLIKHWMKGYGARYNPTRKEALQGVKISDRLEDAVEDITRRFGQKPRTFIPDAKVFPQSVSYARARDEIKRDGGPVLLVFGTAWGLEKGIIERADVVLAPIKGVGEYNHLPVRAAIAIILDRLLGNP
jgi:hypothetical protein